MNKTIAAAIWVLMAAVTGCVMGSIYFAVVLGLMDAIFHGAKFDNDYAFLLGRKSGVLGFGWGLPAGVICSLGALEERYEGKHLIVGGALGILLVILPVYAYFNQSEVNLFANYKFAWLVLVGLFGLFWKITEGLTGTKM